MVEHRYWANAKEESLGTRSILVLAAGATPFVPAVPAIVAAMGVADVPAVAAIAGVTQAQVNASRVAFDQYSVNEALEHRRRIESAPLLHGSREVDDSRQSTCQSQL